MCSDDALAQFQGWTRHLEESPAELAEARADHETPGQMELTSQELQAWRGVPAVGVVDKDISSADKPQLQVITGPKLPCMSAPAMQA